MTASTETLARFLAAWQKYCPATQGNHIIDNMFVIQGLHRDAIFDKKLYGR